jgi:DNA-binding response OmpR family regulator
MTIASAALLIVDDDEMNRQMLARRLTRQGFWVTTAHDGREALQLIRSRAFDLVLLDVMMPELSGLELLRIVRKTRSVTELPIIMTTALDGSQDIVDALEFGANDYVTKPFDFAVVLARIQAHLQIKRLAQPAAPAPGANGRGVAPGSVVAGKYRIDSLIGAGSTGTVYRATHVILGHQVAVKILRTSATTTPEQRARFQREGVAACRIKHPNAVAVIDFGVTPDGITYLVMELLEGHALVDTLTAAGPLTPDRCLEIALPVCAVLAEAHRLCIIHRDLKPANVFLHRTRQGEVVKVVDFGIAKMLDDATQAAAEHTTLVGHVLGTPAYMAPERLQNLPYDGRADVYSLGVMLYQMLAGRLPFEAPDNDPLKVGLMQINDPPPPLRAWNPQVPTAVEAVILNALAKNPAHRLDAADFADAFTQVVRGPGRRAADLVRSALPHAKP